MKTALLLCASLCIAACASTLSSGPNGGLPFRTLLRGYQSGVDKECVRIAHTPAEWTSLWREHSTNELPRPAEPHVDWSKDMVVFVALGRRPSGGFGVEIDKLSLDGGALRVEAHETKPAPERLVPMVVSTPYHAITTPRRDGPVRLVLC